MVKKEKEKKKKKKSKAINFRAVQYKLVLFLILIRFWVKNRKVL